MQDEAPGNGIYSQAITRVVSSDEGRKDYD